MKLLYSLVVSQAINIGGAEQLSSVQPEDLVGMIRYAEKSRIFAVLYSPFGIYLFSLLHLYQFTLKYIPVFPFLL